MIIIESGGFYVGHLEDPAVPEKDRAKLMGLTNEEFADELAEMLDEALPIADPVVLFGISPVTANEEQVMVNGVAIQDQSTLVPDQIQQGSLTTAGSTGNTYDHTSISASMIRKAAAFFSRFCTA